ncbi:MAG: hypothetical protein ACTS45_00840 [Candidatus Hodgkinia cicadicola]
MRRSIIWTTSINPPMGSIGGSCKINRRAEVVQFRLNERRSDKC